MLCVSSGDYIASIEGETALAGSREIPFYGNDGWDNVVEGTIYLMEDGNVTLESRYVSENPMAMWGLSVESCVLPKYDQWLPDGQLPPLSGMSWESEETAQDVPEAYITLDAIFDNMARAKAYYSDTYVYVQDAKILSIYDDYLAVTSDTGFDWLDAKFTNPEELYQLHEGQYICFTGTCKFDDAWNIFSFEDCVLQAWS